MESKDKKWRLHLPFSQLQQYDKLTDLKLKLCLPESCRNFDSNPTIYGTSHTMIARMCLTVWEDGTESSSCPEDELAQSLNEVTARLSLVTLSGGSYTCIHIQIGWGMKKWGDESQKWADKERFRFPDLYRLC